MQTSREVSFPANTQYEPLSARLGGMAVVYFCLDKETGQDVVLKTFREHFLHDRADRLRFLQEACDWIYIGAHPNLVQAFRVEVLQSPQQPYLVLEAIPGHKLGDDVSISSILSSLPTRQLPIRSSLVITLHVIRAMQHATHKIEYFVHRDIKPANILLDPSGVARLTDFGVARSFDPSGAASSFINNLSDEDIKTFRPAGSSLYIVLVKS